MVAVIGGETHRFRPLIDLYRAAGQPAGCAPERLKIGIHSIGFLDDTTLQAADGFYPGYAHASTQIVKERGLPATTLGQYEPLRGLAGAT